MSRSCQGIVSVFLFKHWLIETFLHFFSFYIELFSLYINDPLLFGIH